MWGIAPASAIPGPLCVDVGTKLAIQPLTLQKPSTAFDITRPFCLRSRFHSSGMKIRVEEIKKEDEISAHPATSPSTIPLTSGIEEAPQLLLSVEYIFITSNGLFASCS
jgi:hypothetical protein